MLRTPRGLCPELIIVATSLIGLCSSPVAVLSCPYSIRDAGFIVREPRPYKIAIIINDHTPLKEQLSQWLSEAAKQHLANSNVEAEIVNLDHPPTSPSDKDLVARAPESLPAAFLISPRNKILRLRGLGPNSLSRQAVQQVVRRVVLSPKRKELTDHIISDWCVVVLVKGTDARENQRVTQIVRTASKAIVGKITTMGHKIERPPYIMTISPEAAGEKIFLSSLELTSSGKSQAQVAVLFGMGRRLGPVLVASGISESVLTNAFLLLGHNCTCTSEPGRLFGPVTPLVWGEDLHKQVYDERGFDPTQPGVAATLGGVWTSLDTFGSEDSQRSPDAAARSLPSLSPGYVEFSVEPETKATAAGSQADNGSPTIQQRILHIVIGLGIALALIAVGGGTILLLRSNRRL